MVSLSALKGDPNLVGLGWLSALRGEIAIVPNEIWVAYPKDDGTPRANVLGPSDETAAFLVTASVPAWQTLPLPEDTAFDDLADAVEQLGASAGLDVERPFPFLVEGSLANLEYHVVDGRSFQDGGALSSEVLRVAAAKGKRASVEGLLVGFYGEEGQPEFLEEGSRLHIHVVLRAEQQMGHVDRVDLPRGITFRVPSPR